MSLQKNVPDIILEVDLVTALAVVANIQLATRHPQNTGPSRKRAEDFARQLQEGIVKLQPGLSDVLNMGWDPQYDDIEP